MSKVWISMSLGLAGLLCGSLAASAQADGAPVYDIRKVCVLEYRVGSGPVDRASYRGCLSNERAARRSVQRRWADFGSTQRRICREENEIGGAPSYVALLTCLQLGSGTLPLQPSPPGAPERAAPRATGAAGHRVRAMPSR